MLCLFTSQVPSKQAKVSPHRTHQEKEPTIRAKGQWAKIKDELVESKRTVSARGGCLVSRVLMLVRGEEVSGTPNCALETAKKYLHEKGPANGRRRCGVITKSKLGVVWFQEDIEQLWTAKSLASRTPNLGRETYRVLCGSIHCV
jgi:hypothetical protein